MGWTEEQLRAIEARGSNLLLSAAAGSGKTTVLVERVLRLILEDGADVDRMLVVTFTRAAASDMRAKLSKKLAEMAGSGDVRCREQMIRLERASITTLHAFCADFLRTHFEIAGVDPAFRILDDPIQRRLMDEALDEVMEEAYADPSSALLALDYGRGPKAVRALTESLCRVLEERPDPEEWLARAAQGDLIPLWMDELVRGAKRAILSARTTMVQAMALPGCPPQYIAAIEKDLAALEPMLAIDEYDPLLRAIEDFSPARAAGGRRSEPVDEAAQEAVKRLRDSAKEQLKSIRLRDHPTAQAIADARAQSEQLRELGRLAQAVSERFEEKKAEQSGLTYADLERRTLIALRDDDTARSVRERFDYVFVDEYQDTSDIQEAIVFRVCRADNRFMVGDVKQSIYRFRLAEPRLFIDKYERYLRGDGGTLIPLTRNFRSKPTILRFVNMIFERVMTGGDAEITYDQLARLNPGLDDGEPGAPVEIHLLEKTSRPDEEIDEAIAELKTAERQGLFIARRIREMMAEDESLRYRDFAILTRSKASAFTPMLPMLLAEGIPAYADGATGYFDSMEVALALSMLKLIANRRSDVELIGVLRSPVVGLTTDELARIRIAHRDVPYVDAVYRYAYGRDVLTEPVPEGDASPEGGKKPVGANISMGDVDAPTIDADAPNGDVDASTIRTGASTIGAGASTDGSSTPIIGADASTTSAGTSTGSAGASTISAVVSTGGAGISTGGAGTLSHSVAIAANDSPDLPGDPLAVRLRAFLEMLERWRLRAGAVGLGELVRSVLDESGFYAYAGALPGGAQRQANLDRLAGLADNFDSDVSGSVVRFLSHTGRLREKGDGDAAHLLGENDDVVRLMTVHKSKGLEFKVVFGALLDKSYGGAKAELLSAHRELGMGISHFDPVLRTKRKSLAQSAILERRAREDAAEEMRILYVLLTRARERLVLVGSVRDVERANGRWDALSHAVSGANSHLDLIMAARCAALRDGAEVYSTLTVHSAAELSGQRLDAPDPRAIFDEILANPGKFADPKLDAELAWRYPDALSARKPLKLTVSGMLRELEGPEQLPALAERPQFLAEESARHMTGTERGTAYHRAMQLLNLAALDGLDGRALTDGVRSQLDAMLEQKRISDAQHEAVRPSMLAKFLSGEVGLRLRSAETVRREWPFNVMLRASEALSPEEAGVFAGEELLVQGSIDCCFLEGGAWILLDYKTDRSDDLDALRAHYRKQLSVYALALERITGIPVRQKLLCLLASDRVLEI